MGHHHIQGNAQSERAEQHDCRPGGSPDRCRRLASDLQDRHGQRPRRDEHDQPRCGAHESQEEGRCKSGDQWPDRPRFVHDVQRRTQCAECARACPERTGRWKHTEQPPIGHSARHFPLDLILEQRRDSTEQGRREHAGRIRHLIVSMDSAQHEDNKQHERDHGQKCVVDKIRGEYLKVVRSRVAHTADNDCASRASRPLATARWHPSREGRRHRRDHATAPEPVPMHSAVLAPRRAECGVSPGGRTRARRRQTIGITGRRRDSLPVEKVAGTSLAMEACDPCSSSTTA